MHSTSYRLNAPTVAIVICDGQKVATTILRGAIVIALTANIKGSGLVNVIWEGQPAIVFAQDIRERGELEQRAGSRRSDAFQAVTA